MNENVLIKAKFKKNYASIVFLAIAVVLAMVSLSIANDIYMSRSRYVSYGFGVSARYTYRQMYKSVFEFYFEEFLMDYGWYTIAAGVFAAAALFTFLLFRCDLVVTDRRVYGKAAFGSRIDLPISKISSISLGANLFSSISVATSSGKLVFYLLQNREEVYQTISGAIAVAEKNAPEVIEKKVEPVASSTADELKKLKELLDCGVITQEEFDAKKKQLLGL